MINESTYLYAFVPVWIVSGILFNYWVFNKTQFNKTFSKIITRALCISLAFAAVPLSPDNQGYTTIIAPLWSVDLLFNMQPSYIGTSIYSVCFVLVTALSLYLMMLARKPLNKISEAIN